MLTQYSEVGEEAFNILYEVTYRDNLPADHTEAVEGLLVRLRAHHRMCHVLAACLPPVQRGSMFIPGTDGEPVLHSSTHSLSICTSILLSVRPFVRPSTCTFIHLLIRLFVHSSICPSSPSPVDHDADQSVTKRVTACKAFEL